MFMVLVLNTKRVITYNVDKKLTMPTFVSCSDYVKEGEIHFHLINYKFSQIA